MMRMNNGKNGQNFLVQTSIVTCQLNFMMPNTIRRCTYFFTAAFFHLFIVTSARIDIFSSISTEFFFAVMMFTLSWLHLAYFVLKQKLIRKKVSALNFCTNVIQSARLLIIQIERNSTFLKDYDKSNRSASI